MAMDMVKAFDSLNHRFLIQVWKKMGFGTEFVTWIEILLNCPESCVLNAGNTTPYFHLEKGARQGDPISAYLFILSLEILFLMIKENKKIKGLDLFDHHFLYSAYADDATFFYER